MHLCTQRYYYLATLCIYFFSGISVRAHPAENKNEIKINDFNRINSDNWFVWFERANEGGIDSLHLHLQFTFKQARTCDETPNKSRAYVESKKITIFTTFDLRRPVAIKINHFLIVLPMEASKVISICKYNFIKMDAISIKVDISSCAFIFSMKFVEKTEHLLDN